MPDHPPERHWHPAMQAAVDWLVRRDAGPLSAAEQTAFAAWLGDPEHGRAYGEAERLWSDLGRLPVPVAVAVHAPRRPWRMAAIGGVAAAMCVLLSVGMDLPLRLRADALSGIGEMKAVALPDGSTVTLNTDSAIAIDYSTNERRVRLLRGEAEFTVAKAGGRPFRVEAAGGTSTALGTVFLVRRHAEGATVTVIESRVAVAHEREREREIVLAANERVTYSDGFGPVEQVDPHAAASWPRGKLIFADRPLGEVIDELNRYHVGQIRILDTSLRDRRVNGVFETRAPVAVIDALERSLGLRSTRLSNWLILLHR